MTKAQRDKRIKKIRQQISPILFETYGRNQICKSLALHLAEQIEGFPGNQPLGFERDRIQMIRTTCWHWFSGGTTAAAVAIEIDKLLDA